MTRKQVGWWLVAIVMTAEISLFAAYSDEMLATARQIYLAGWQYLPIPEGAERPTYRAER